MAKRDPRIFRPFKWRIFSLRTMSRTCIAKKSNIYGRVQCWKREREREAGDSFLPSSPDKRSFICHNSGRAVGAKRGEAEEKEKEEEEEEEARNETAPSVERHRPSSPKVIYFVWWPRACAAIQTWQFLPGLI